MIALPAGVQVWLAAGATDMRKGFDGLCSLVHTRLSEDPYSGQLFVFRGRAGDRVKIIWWSGDGLCMFAKRLERGVVSDEEQLNYYMTHAVEASTIVDAPILVDKFLDNAIEVDVDVLADFVFACGLGHVGFDECDFRALFCGKLRNFPSPPQSQPVVPCFTQAVARGLVFLV